MFESGTTPSCQSQEATRGSAIQGILGRLFPVECSYRPPGPTLIPVSSLLDATRRAFTNCASSYASSHASYSYGNANHKPVDQLAQDALDLPETSPSKRILQGGVKGADFDPRSFSSLPDEDTVYSCCILSLIVANKFNAHCCAQIERLRRSIKPLVLMEEQPKWFITGRCVSTSYYPMFPLARMHRSLADKIWVSKLIPQASF